MAGEATGGLPPAVEAAIARAASDAGGQGARVELVGYDPVDWPDAALGVPRPGTLAAQIVTPGYRVRLAVEGRPVTYHTDRAGRVVRAP